MSGLGNLDVALGDLDAESRRDHGEVLLERLVDPGLLAALLRVRNRQVFLGPREFRVQLAGDLRQQLARHGECALGGDHVSRADVPRRAGFLDVNDRDDAHFEAPLGLAQLLPNASSVASAERNVSAAASTSK